MIFTPLCRLLQEYCGSFHSHFLLLQGMSCMQFRISALLVDREFIPRLKWPFGRFMRPLSCDEWRQCGSSPVTWYPHTEDWNTKSACLTKHRNQPAFKPTSFYDLGCRFPAWQLQHTTLSIWRTRCVTSSKRQVQTHRRVFLPETASRQD
jgi:hypothetical protein